MSRRRVLNEKPDTVERKPSQLHKGDVIVRPYSAAHRGWPWSEVTDVLQSLVTGKVTVVCRGDIVGKFQSKTYQVLVKA